MGHYGKKGTHRLYNKRVKKYKAHRYATGLALLPIGFIVYFLNPPQCPISFTQEQIDSSRCIAGANIGGPVVSIISAVVILVAVYWLVKWYLKRKSTAVYGHTGKLM